MMDVIIEAAEDGRFGGVETELRGGVLIVRLRIGARSYPRRILRSGELAEPHAQGPPPGSDEEG